MPKKDEVWEALVAHADERGHVKAEPDELRRPLALSNHDFTKYLWDWKAQGKLTFKEVKTGGQTSATGIVLHINGSAPRGVKTGLMGDVVNAILALPTDEQGWRPFASPRLTAPNGRFTTAQLTHVLHNLRSANRLEQRGGGKGHPITAVRFIHERPVAAVDDYLGHLDAAVKEASRTFPITEARVANYSAAEELAQENKFLTFRRDPELDELVALLRLAKEEEGS